MSSLNRFLYKILSRYDENNNQLRTDIRGLKQKDKYDRATFWISASSLTVTVVSVFILAIQGAFNNRSDELNNKNVLSRNENVLLEIRRDSLNRKIGENLTILARIQTDSIALERTISQSKIDTAILNKQIDKLRNQKDALDKRIVFLAKDTANLRKSIREFEATRKSDYQTTVFLDKQRNDYEYHLNHAKYYIGNFVRDIREMKDSVENYHFLKMRVIDLYKISLTYDKGTFNVY